MASFTDEQLAESLSQFMDEESVAEVVKLINTVDVNAPNGEGFRQLQTALSSAGVPQQFVGPLLSGAAERYTKRQTDLNSAASNLGKSNWEGELDHATPYITAQNVIDMAQTENPEQFFGGPTTMGADDPNNPYANINWDQLNAGVDANIAQMQAAEAERKAAADREALAQSRNNQFGNDMAWLDAMFQQDPAEIMKQAQAMGTTADPEAAKQQQALVDDVRGRGLTADQKSRDAQQGVVDELGSIYDQGGTTARDRMLRAKARAESENWLKGQREADMQDLAERGMDGGGAELLTLLGDRQDAATRLSMADLQASADSEQRALDALMGKGAMASQMEGAANQYTQGNDALAGQLLGGMRSASDAYTQGNADIISKVAQTNKDFLRDAYQQTMDRRQAWDRDVMNNQIDMSKFLADLDARENAAGWGFGYNTANQDANNMNNARTGFNNSTQGAFTGQTGMVRGAGNQQVAYTGAPQAHAGQAFSGAANFVGNLFSGLYGGGGGGGSQQTTMQQPYQPAGEQTGMDERYR